MEVSSGAGKMTLETAVVGEGTRTKCTLSPPTNMEELLHVAFEKKLGEKDAFSGDALASGKVPKGLQNTATSLQKHQKGVLEFGSRRADQAPAKQPQSGSSSSRGHFTSTCLPSAVPAFESLFPSLHQIPPTPLSLQSQV